VNLTYKSGDFWRICDVCGFKYRSSETRQRWDNLMVCLADWEPRHPQDFVRGVSDRQNVPDPRPELTDTFIGPLQTETTAAASAGAVTLTITSSVGFAAADLIGVMLSNGELHSAIVQAVPDSTSLTLATGLSGAVASGAVVVNYSAISPPNVG
jgi:hypothetical protein